MKHSQPRRPDDKDYGKTLSVKEDKDMKLRVSIDHKISSHASSSNQVHNLSQSIERLLALQQLRKIDKYVDITGVILEICQSVNAFGRQRLAVRMDDGSLAQGVHVWIDVDRDSQSKFYESVQEGDLVCFNSVMLKQKVERKEGPTRTVYHLAHQQQMPVQVPWRQIYRIPSHKAMIPFDDLIFQNHPLHAHWENIFEWYKAKGLSPTKIATPQCQPRTLSTMLSCVGTMGNVHVRRVSDAQFIPPTYKRQKILRTPAHFLARLEGCDGAQMVWIDKTKKLTNVILEAVRTQCAVRITRARSECIPWLRQVVALVPTDATVVQLLPDYDASRDLTQTSILPSLTPADNASQVKMDSSTTVITAPLSDIIVGGLSLKQELHAMSVQNEFTAFESLIFDEFGNYRSIVLLLDNDHNNRYIGSGKLLSLFCWNLSPCQLRAEPHLRDALAQCLYALLVDDVPIQWTVHDDDSSQNEVVDACINEISIRRQRSYKI